MSKIDREMKDRLLQLALDHQAKFASWIETTRIPFDSSLRDMCAQNSCGLYGTSWMGPPAIGSFEKLKADALTYEDCLVVQTVYQLEDAYDYPGMMEAKAEHQAIFIDVLDAVKNALSPDIRLLAISAGCCQICGECAYPDEPCRRPDEAIASVSAYGIFVSELLNRCGLKYKHGPDTVSYIGLIMLRTPC